jgi:putative flippase GtrA
MRSVWDLLGRLRDDRHTQRLLTRYLLIGGFVFCLDVGSFQALLKAALFRPLATTASFLIAISAHFTLNRFFNFRRFERSALAQARTYSVVAGVSLLLSIVIVEAGVRLLGLPPIVAKIIAVAVNVPVGFLGHRYLTFGAGIGVAVRRLRARSQQVP